jgi:signal transduction histidine kinase
MGDHVAVLDRRGTILQVNDAWNRFGLAHGVKDLAAIGRQVNYLDVCAKAARQDVPGAARAHDGIKSVCSGLRREFELDYLCSEPGDCTLFLMNVTRLRHRAGGAVVSHRNVTAWRETRAPTVPVLSRLGIQLHSLRGRLMKARQDERRHIARELHDDVIQRLALLAIRIEQVSLSSPDTTIGARVHDLWVETTSIAEGVHKLSHELHSSRLELLGVAPAIRAMSRDFLARGLRVTVEADDHGLDLPAASALCLFRVAQEALTNVLKHSGTSEATVALKRMTRSVRLQIEDRGRGFDAAASHDGVGLLSMRERMTINGGKLLIRARPGEGTVVEAHLSRAEPCAEAPGRTPIFAS